ncbi:hypothetical protein ACHQM5_013392 [Ranunculus cassubicifolius]
MVRYGCAGGGPIDDSKFSDPVPVIGLYIASATLVCLGFIISDVLSAYRKKQRWLPCRLFCLNSMTLTLLSVVAKLPVDLTSSMPSAQDQLSKITSTAMICTGMGFFMPTIGISKEPESLANMGALTIFVVTVVGNLCMQMYTGVIFLFIVEHVILMFCMLAMLIMLWFLARAITHHKRDFIENQKDLVQKGEKSMLQRLKTCYLYGFTSNPQFVPCKDPHSANIGFLSVVTMVVVLQASIRSLIMHELQFCGGVSDYGFSMWIIVISQIITVLIGCSATSFRWISMVTQMRGGKIQKFKLRNKTYVNPVLGIAVRDKWKDVWENSTQMGQYFMIMVVLIPARAVNQIVRMMYYCFVKKNKGNREIEEVKDLKCRDEIGFDEWTLSKSVEEMKRSMGISKTVSINCLSELLLNTPPSQQLDTLELKDQVYFDEGIEVSLLSMVLLVRIGVLSLPSSFGSSLAQAFTEAYEFVDFANDRINFASIKNKEKSELAKLVWKGRDFHVLFPVIFAKINSDTFATQSEIDRAVFIIKELKNAMASDVLWDEVGTVTEFLNRRNYSSIEELYEYMKQILVDMLHLFLAELPVVIYDEVKESPPEDYEERLRVCLKLLWKIKPLEGIIQWSFPVGCDISSLISHVPDIEIQDKTSEEANASDDTLEQDVRVHVS